MFPSPLGDEVLKPSSGISQKGRTYGSGFRPLSGMRCLNLATIETVTREAPEVSVPSRG